MYGTFECTVSIVNERRREAISGDLYERRKAELGDAGAGGGSVLGGDLDTEDEDLIGFESLEAGLPAASSDRQKWWLDNKQAARAHIPIPTGRHGQPMSLNPHRPSNPFPSTDEPDWVSVSRASPGAASSLSSSPYEKVPMPPRTMSMASNGSSSKRPGPPPPPSDPARLPAQFGKLAMADDQASMSSRRSTDSERQSQQQPPPPPPPRRRAVGQQPPATPTTTSQLPPRPGSSASQQSLLAKEGGSKPPIARKPAHLAGSSPVAGRSPTQQQPPLPPRSEASRRPQPPPTESLI